MPLSLLLACALAAAPLLEAGALDRALRELSRHATEPLPILSPAERTQLGRGEVVSLYLSAAPQAAGGALGLVVLRQPRDRLWRVARGDQAETARDLTTQRLAVDGGDEISYGHLRLPWPFEARRWQVRSRDNAALAAATGGRARERAWDLEPGEEMSRAAVARGLVPGVTTEDFERAIAVPLNRGAWYAVDLDGQHTLLGFRVTTRIGGFIPDELVARYSVLRVAEQLRDVETRARALPPEAPSSDVARR